MKEAQNPEEGVGQGPIIRISGGTIEKVMSGTVNLSMDRVDEPSSDIHTQVKEGRSFWELSIPSIASYKAISKRISFYYVSKTAANAGSATALLEMGALGEKNIV